MQMPKPMYSCSKGSRGLSVPLRVIGVITDTTISPSSWPRQCSSRYTIRAGRNLPDKEFRYLRTVIVTAAVYRGFRSEERRVGKEWRSRWSADYERRKGGGVEGGHVGECGG